MSNKEVDARSVIDAKLESAGWIVQDFDKICINAGLGVIVREFPTSTGPVDYLVIVDKMPVGIIEAKKDELGGNLTEVELQTERYNNSVFGIYDRKLNLRFIYQATSQRIRFTDRLDIVSQARDIFSFQTPENLKMLIDKKTTFRNEIRNSLPELSKDGLRDCQFDAINHLEDSLKHGRQRALIQMATGSGKTFTAITSTYRLLRYAKANRILFLVDTKNLGKQALDEFSGYKTVDSMNFTEIYGAIQLKQSVMPQNHNVYICTIQRLFSMLTGESIADEDEERTAADLLKKQPREVEYNKEIPPEFFDMIIVDECHRSIYNVWAQIFDYFDAFVVGLTATPDKRTLGFFKGNLVSEYTREQAIIDNVNVGSDTWIIKTDIQKNGAVIHRANVEKRDRLTKVKRWEQLEEDIPYESTDLDKTIVNKTTIRTIIEAFKTAMETQIIPTVRASFLRRSYSQRTIRMPMIS